MWPIIPLRDDREEKTKEMIEMANSAVAVVVGSNGVTASLLDADVSIRVFRKELDEWIQEKELPVELHPEKGLTGVREEIKRLISELDNARVLVAGDISGVAYNAFDVAGYAVFQIPEKQPQDFLGFVLASVEKQQEDLQRLQSGLENGGDIPQPQPLGEDGTYYLDMIQAQMDNPNATSKQLLKPFLKNQTFYELVVICSHIPPWFDREFEGMKLTYEKEIMGQERYKVTIHAASCQ